MSQWHRLVMARRTRCMLPGRSTVSSRDRACTRTMRRLLRAFVNELQVFLSRLSHLMCDGNGSIAVQVFLGALARIARHALLSSTMRMHRSTFYSVRV